MMSVFQEKPIVLIIDDMPENIKVLGEALRPEHKILFAVNGEDGVKMALSNKTPDLVLLDIMMPDMDGYEVCRILKSKPRTRHTPVIFITAKNEEEDETRGFELGAVDYITKPFSRAVVKARVNTHLELKRNRDILENLSSLDGLTNIPNRRRFNEYFDREWRHAIRESKPLSLLMIDIDCFKSYNDHYGHLRGDECLKSVAEVLSDTIKRPLDFVARYGGEEFVVVLPGNDVLGAAFVAEKLRKAVESLQIPHQFSLVSEHITVSLGAASLIPRYGMSSQLLINSGDRALYTAKAEGKNQVISIEVEVTHP